MLLYPGLDQWIVSDQEALVETTPARDMHIGILLTDKYPELFGDFFPLLASSSFYIAFETGGGFLGSAYGMVTPL